MAIYSLDMRTITRSTGRSATGAAAYRAGVVIEDQRTGIVFDFTRKKNVWGHTSYVAPLDPEMGGAVSFPRDWIESLWNGCEQSEKRINSVVARELIIALPAELTDSDRFALAAEMTKWMVLRFGVAATCAIHRPDRKGDKRNHHAHILFSTRKVTHDISHGENGIAVGKKTRELDDRWSGSLAVTEIREKWESLANAALDFNELELIDRRSLKDRGIKRQPRIHRGPAVSAMETKGIKTRVGDHNRRIDAEERDEIAQATAAAAAAQPAPVAPPGPTIAPPAPKAAVQSATVTKAAVQSATVTKAAPAPVTPAQPIKKAAPAPKPPAPAPKPVDRTPAKKVPPTPPAAPTKKRQPVELVATPERSQAPWSPIQLPDDELTLAQLYIWSVRNAREAWKRMQTDESFAKLFRLAKAAIAKFKDRIDEWIGRGGAGVDVLARKAPNMDQVASVLERHGYDLTVQLAPLQLGKEVEAPIAPPVIIHRDRIKGPAR